MEGGYEHVSRYGRQGQKQQGIDIYARLSNGRYVVWQAKRYAKYTASNLRSAVKVFLAGTWVEKTDRLVIAVQASLDDTTFQDELERQTRLLSAKGIVLVAMGGDALTEELRAHKSLVLSFFGRHWAKAFYGKAFDEASAASLDGLEFAQVRDQLATFYKVRFSDLDPGMVASEFTGPGGGHRPLPLLERFTLTDVYVRERRTDIDLGANHGPRELSGSEARPRQAISVVRDEKRRVPILDWLADGDQIAVIADAGAGKTSLLRSIALDLLSDQKIFLSLARRWGERLPIVIPFAKWSRATARKGDEVGLKEIVEQVLQPLLTANLVSLINRAVDERRILLIVDGLDEWSDEQAARTALQTLLTYTHLHQVPTIVSGRPLGLQKIGSLPQSWKSGQLAPLSLEQQRHLANVWFDHILSERISTPLASSMSKWHADRFIRELRSDGSSGDLGETPLLFVGLLFLTMREVALPQDRTEALRSLVKLLLEIHPEARATAAGDVRPRFEATLPASVRLNAIAAMAFASRMEGGDAGYPKADARNAIALYLRDDAGYEVQQASSHAEQLLAVNSETIGLVVEKGPDEIGFAHASLEEFLSAQHIQSWPFDRLLNFVTLHVGSPRWKNVLRNVISLTARPNEIAAIVEAVENAQLDPMADMARRQLLAEVTFSQSAMDRTTAVRLAESAFGFVESPGLAPARADIARLVVKGLADPVLAPLVESKIKRWAPRRLNYSSEIYQAISTFGPDEEVFTALLSGLGDEDRTGSRAAAQAIAKVFGNDPSKRPRVLALTASTSTLETASAALMALTLGWPESVSDLTEAALESASPLLRATAIWSRVQRKDIRPGDLEICLELATEYSFLDYVDRELVHPALLSGWPNDEFVTGAALQSLEERGGWYLDRELAAAYLTSTEPGHLKVKRWILSELSKEHPFTMRYTHSWDWLKPFCDEDGEIREAAVQSILLPNHEFQRHQTWQLIAQLKDDRLKNVAISQVRTQRGHMRYWNLLTLLRGWNDDPEVSLVKQEIIETDDNDLNMCAAFLPELYANRDEARARLLRIARLVPNARLDILSTAFSDLGCDGSDGEVVEALLPLLKNSFGALNDAPQFFFLFRSHPAVRDAAIARLALPEPPLGFIGRAFPEEEAIRDRLFDTAYSLSVDVRSEIATAAALGADRHQVLYDTLANYDLEVDFTLKVQLAIDYHSMEGAMGNREDLLSKATQDLDRVGILHEQHRSTAFAALLALGEPERLLAAQHEPGAVHLTSLMGAVNATFCTMIADRWVLLKSRLGDDFLDKFSDRGEKAWHTLVEYIGGSPAARLDFLEWCRSQPQVGFKALVALGDFWPGSEELMRLVHEALASSDESAAATTNTIVAAKILANQFRTPENIAAVTERFLRDRGLTSAVALSIIDPTNEVLLKPRVAPLDIGLLHQRWLAGVQISAGIDKPEAFVDVVHAMAERKARLGYEGQSTMSSAIVNRLLNDPLAVKVLNERIEASISASAFAASASLLTASGKLSAKSAQLCQVRLSAEFARDGLPTGVFDVMQDEYRPFSHVLMDIARVATT